MQIYSVVLFFPITDDILFPSDYDTLRALDSDNSPEVPSMSEEEINALPVHKYKAQSHQGSTSVLKG